jgi:hypothetical protein
MTARLIRPFHVRLDVRTGKAEMARSRAAPNNGGSAPHSLPAQKNSDAGSIKVARDDRPIADERREPAFSPPLKSSNGGSIKVQRDDRTATEERREPSFSLPLESSNTEPIKVVRDGKAGTDEYAQAPLPRRTETSDDRAIRVLRDDNAGTDEYARAAVPPRTETSADTSIDVLRNDATVDEERREPSLSPPSKSSDEAPAEVTRDEKIVIEDLEREHQFRAALASSVQAGNRLKHQHERLETGTIIRIAAAVIVVGLGSTALLPSILTRNPVGPTVTLTTSSAPAEPAQTEQVGGAQPVREPRPELPAAAPPVPAPPSKNATSVATAPPVLRGSNTPEVQGEARPTAQFAVPDAGKTDGGLALTAAEKAAVTRGLQELEKQAAVTTPPPPRPRAPGRPQLTDEEKAAIERGLRELEKTAGQAAP